MITGLILLTGTNAPQRVGDNSSFFASVTFWGYSGFSNGLPMVNADSVYLGASVNALPIEVTAGSTAGITLFDKRKDNLYNYFAAGISGNGIYYMGW